MFHLSLPVRREEGKVIAELIVRVSDHAYSIAGLLEWDMIARDPSKITNTGWLACPIRELR